MKLDLYQIDSFTDKIFGGNPACVVPLESWLPDDLLFKIAKENAVAETAFFIPLTDSNSEVASFDLRWFTPEIEMDLCGHATLATAHVLKRFLSHTENSISFQSKSGILEVSVANDMYTLNFPSRMPVEAELPGIIKTSLSIQPKEVFKSRDYVLVYASEEEITGIQINRQILDQINLDPGGVVITAPGNDCDFVSRYFTPQASIFEDPVTGSSHCSLIPFWSKRLNRKQMTALQLSDRVGKLYCEDKDERVLIAGNARTYSVGTIWID
ncbi:PhzF family phenazine biosynthesis protein [Lacibacter sp. H375]|uniref:PhzF family phenazine biosynthesis protein n=1 Tax=Lacibacter sp. H375 TaxID=3133424 RepID=UPI0030C3784A